MRIVFKNFPLGKHFAAWVAHEAALVAAARNKFWEMHDLIRADQSHHDPATLIAYGRQLGIDPTDMVRAFETRPHRELIAGDVRDGRDLISPRRPPSS